MPISGAFRTIADTIEALEQAGYDISHVTTEAPDTSGSTVSLNLTIGLDLFTDVELPDTIDIEQRDASIRDDGSFTLQFALTSQSGESETKESVPGDHTNPSAAGTRGPNQSSPGSQGSEPEQSVPPHRDPEALQQVYETYDTFEAMREALDTDVTANTVRRNMVKHGIHDPDTRSNQASSTPSPTEQHSSEQDQEPRPEEARDSQASEGTAEADPASDDQESDIPLADGIDLPQGTTLEELKTTVAQSRTLLEVQRDLGIDRSHARRLLSELDLLDLVSGRLVRDTDVSQEEIEKRIEGAAPSNA